MAADTPMEDVSGVATEEDQSRGEISERNAGYADDGAAPYRAEQLAEGEDEDRGDAQLDDVSDRADAAVDDVSDRNNDANDGVSNREINREIDANDANGEFEERVSEDDERDLEDKEKDWDAESEQLEDEPGEDADMADDVADELADDVAGLEDLGEGVANNQEQENEEKENDEVVGEEKDGEGAKAADESEGGLRMVTFPLARVKRIVKLDPDIKQVSSEALKTIGLATELFLEALAVSTAHVTRAGKRSTLKIEDLLQTVKTRRRYKECLGGDLEYLRTVDENQAAKQAARQSKKQEAARQLPPGVKPITSFFKQ